MKTVLRLGMKHIIYNSTSPADVNVALAWSKLLAKANAYELTTYSKSDSVRHAYLTNKIAAHGSRRKCCIRQAGLVN